MPPFVALVLVLVTWRLTSLLVDDTITAPYRRAVARRYPPRRAVGRRPARPRWQTELVHCGRCTSVWVAGAVTAGAWAAGAVDGILWAVTAWWAIAGAAALLFDWRR